MAVKIIVGDCRQVLRTLPDESVHCVVTSPPYWGLRDYGTGKDGIGLEATLREHVEAMASVFDEVHRVLRADGTLWLNYGDAYTGGGGFSATAPSTATSKSGQYGSKGALKSGGTKPAANGLKAKDLMGLPWRIAFALQERGWWLRQDIIWSKPNPMPESVTDRCTKAHEYIFLMAKSERYFFDADAIKEAASYDPGDTKFPDGWDTGEGGHGTVHRNGREKGRRIKMDDHIDRRKVGFNQRWDATEAERAATRNKRSVWTVGTAPFKEAHFATFPPALIEPCILAGCPKGGTVLDPFGGAGTTGLVADRLGRDAILIELNPAYADMAERRIRDDCPLFHKGNAE